MSRRPGRAWGTRRRRTDPQCRSTVHTDPVPPVPDGGADRVKTGPPGHRRPPETVGKVALPLLEERCSLQVFCSAHMSPGENRSELDPHLRAQFARLFHRQRGPPISRQSPLLLHNSKPRKIKLTIRGGSGKLLQKNGLQLREGIGVKKLAVEIISGRRLEPPGRPGRLPDGGPGGAAGGADQIRQALCGDRADLCTIINGRSGRCSETASSAPSPATHPGGGVSLPPPWRRLWRSADGTRRGRPPLLYRHRRAQPEGDGLEQALRPTPGCIGRAG